MLNPLDPNCSLLLSSRCLEKTTRMSQGSQGSLDLQAINKSKGLSQTCCQVIGTMPFLPTSYKSVLTPKGSLEHFFLCLSCTCHLTKIGEQEPPALTPFLSFTARQLTEIQGLVLFFITREIDDEERHLQHEILKTRGGRISDPHALFQPGPTYPRT